MFYRSFVIYGFERVVVRIVLKLILDAEVFYVIEAYGLIFIFF